MLYYETIYPKTLGLLKQINSINEFSDFHLAGGTSLALQIGHRISVDLDFFGKTEISHEVILDFISDISSPTILTQSRNILILNVQNVKVDFVKYKYPLLKPPLVIDDLRLFSLEDIGAMKLAAIIGRGKKRDFFDIYFLLNHFTMRELIQFYNEKYYDGSEFILAKSLVYFEDAEEDEIPDLLEKIEWEMVKEKISTEVSKLY